MIKIIENNTPNVSLEIFYDESKNCTEVRLNAWHPLNEDEVKDIKEFITKRKESGRKPYPLGGFGGKVVGMETTNGDDREFKVGPIAKGWAFEEAGPIDPRKFETIKAARLATDYGTVGPLADLHKGQNLARKWRTVELSEEAKAAFKEAVEKNFNKGREAFVMPAENQDEIKNHMADALEYRHLYSNPVPRRDISIEDLLTKFVFRNHDHIKGQVHTLGAGEVIEFAKLVRVLTIQETTEGISARLTVPDGTETYGAGNFTAVPWVDKRPNENIIKLPKDFTI